MSVDNFRLDVDDGRFCHMLVQAGEGGSGGQPLQHENFDST